MASFMKKIQERDTKTRKFIAERLKGASTIYMGDPSLQWGMGGWVRGRANLLYGPSGCLDGSTHINYQVVSPDGKRQNHKGGSIERLYERFHGLKRKGKGYYQRSVSAESRFTITSVNDEGSLIRNDIVNVVYSGEKECFEMVTDDGFAVTATKDHKFLSGGRYVALGELRVGDTVSVYDPANKYKKDKKPSVDYCEVLVKYHPSKRYKTVTENGKEYKYCRVAEHRLVVEAGLNGLSVHSYIQALNSKPAEEIDKLVTLRKDVVVHHINEDKRDNRLENLQVMSYTAHNDHHSNLDGGSAFTTITKIKSVKSVGVRKTYDIMCAAPFNNFLANGIVVHNSGKSALALYAAACEQKLTGGWVVIFDSEYSHAGPLNAEEDKALTRYRAAGLDTEKVLVIQSNQVDVLFGDLGAFEKDIKNDELNVSAVIVDSWGGVQNETAKTKIEEGDVASAGNSFGGNAKTMGPILQHLLRLFAENAVTGFFVQHVMVNMDGYGPKYVLLGGQKLRLLVHATLFIETIMAKDANLVEGDQTAENKDVVVRTGKKIRFQCEKSREVIEGRKGEFWFDFVNIKFARPGESLFNLATKLKIIVHTKSPVLEDKGPNKGKQKVDDEGKPMFKENNAWWQFPADAVSPHKFNGADAMIEALTNDQQLYNEVYAACMRSETKDAAGGVKMGVEAGFANAEDEFGDEAKAAKAAKKGKK